MKIAHFESDRIQLFILLVPDEMDIGLTSSPDSRWLTFKVGDQWPENIGRVSSSRKRGSDGL